MLCSSVKTLCRHLMVASIAVALLLVFTCVQAPAQSDRLSSWNEGPTKKAITDFVARVSKQGSPDFVSPRERFATFDNDGTLWAEQPIYESDWKKFFSFDSPEAAELQEGAMAIGETTPAPN